MKRGIFLLNSILLATIIFATGCAGDRTKTPEPYEYTHTTGLKQFEIYETDRMRDAERTVVTTLGQLGYNDLIITGGEETETSPIEFTLPGDATQGPDTWYLINFHFLIEFEEDTGGGFCDVASSPVCLATAADDHDMAGQCRVIIFIPQTGAQAGYYLRRCHRRFHCAVAAAYSTLRLGLGGG